MFKIYGLVRVRSGVGCPRDQFSGGRRCPLGGGANVLHSGHDIHSHTSVRSPAVIYIFTVTQDAVMYFRPANVNYTHTRPYSTR